MLEHPGAEAPGESFATRPHGAMSAMSMTVVLHAVDRRYEEKRMGKNNEEYTT